MRKILGFSALFFLGGIILVGCKKKEKEIGLSVQPQADQLALNVSDTTEIIAYSIKEDSLRIDELDGANMLGSYIDPYFGKMDASIISHVRLQSSVDFTPAGGALDSLVVDSVIMYLTLDGYYGNIDNQTFEVYQIADDIYLDSSYYTNSYVNTVGGDLVAAGAGLIYADPVSTGTVEGVAVDKAILRIPLSVQDFGWKIINESGNTSLNGNDGDGEFVDWFKGLMIKTNNPGQSVNEGGIYYVDLLNDYSKITLFYRDTSGSVSTHDTLSFDFNFNANCARYHTVDFDYTGTYVASEFNDSTLGSDVFFLQSQGGVKAKIAFPFLDQLIVDSNKVINKAELILPFQYYSGDPYAPASSIIITRENDEGKDVFLPDALESGHGGTANFTSNTYTFNITRYVNSIISGEYKNKPLTLITNGSGLTANRTVLNGFYSSNKDKMKLVLTYTKY